MKMKTALKYFFFIFSLLFVTASFAKEKIIAVVSDLKGNAFYTYNGKTKTIRKGMHLPLQAEIFTDMGAQLSINDYYDHIYHLSGGAHMIVHTNLLELKEGYLWVKSLTYDPLRGPFRVTTANSIVEHSEGEGIISFDVYSGKTQVLAVKGDFDFRNIRQEYYQLSLGEGQFSFILNDHENGRPRRPTPIGYASFQKVTGLFEGVEPFKEYEKVKKPMPKAMAKAPSSPEMKPQSTTQMNSFEAALAASETPVKSAPTRGIASANEPEVSSSQGKITVLKLYEPESIEEKEVKLMNYYQDKVSELKPKVKPKKKWRPTYNKKSDVAVHVFGMGKAKAKSFAARIPASVSPEPKKVYKPKKRAMRTPASVGGMTPKLNKSPFETELLRQYKKQMRHDNEVNDLIDQLKSVDMDYKKEY